MESCIVHEGALRHFIEHLELEEQQRAEECWSAAATPTVTATADASRGDARLDAPPQWPPQRQSSWCKLGLTGVVTGEGADGRRAVVVALANDVQTGSRQATGGGRGVGRRRANTSALLVDGAASAVLFFFLCVRAWEVQGNAMVFFSGGSGE